MHCPHTMTPALPAHHASSSHRHATHMASSAHLCYRRRLCNPKPETLNPPCALLESAAHRRIHVGVEVTESSTNKQHHHHPFRALLSNPLCALQCNHRSAHGALRAQPTVHFSLPNCCAPFHLCGLLLIFATLLKKCSCKTTQPAQLLNYSTTQIYLA